MTDFQYVVLSNRLTPFNTTYGNNVVDTDIKDSSSMISCNLSQPIHLEPYSEVRVAYYHLSKGTITANLTSLGVITTSLPVQATNIGNPYNNRLVKLIGFVGNNTERASMDDSMWFSCNNTHVETITNINFQVIRLSDGEQAVDSTAPGADSELLSKNLTIGLQFRVNPHKKQLAIAYKNNELMRGHIEAFKQNLVNKNDPSYIQEDEIVKP